MLGLIASDLLNHYNSMALI